MNTKLRLLRAAARRPLLAVGLVVTTVAVPAAVAALSSFRAAPKREQVVAAADDIDPRLILGRAWFDKYPEKRGDSINLLVFFGGGIGIHDQGSSYRSTIDVFDFERQKDRLLVTHLHDKKKVDTRFKLTRCDDDPPFDVCLDLDVSPGGPRRYHGFLYDDEMDAAIPWGRALVQSAEQRARAR
jgi:hypothetical protein